MIAILDGPMGTELGSRGVPTPSPLWSALALTEAPEVVRSIHRAYAEAGATVHTANTFRSKRRQAGARWEALCRLAVDLARSAVPTGHRVAGSIAPLEDCYRPDLSPPPAEARSEHRELAEALAASGVDLLLCETFPHVGEALIAVEEAARTGLPVWVSFTAGPEGDLLTVEALEAGAREAVRRGAEVVLVNCVPATRTQAFVEGLARVGAPFGAYANAGGMDEGIGWGAPDAAAAEVYAGLARGWAAAGATVIGGCCGTGPAHVAALARAFGGAGARRQ
jgi:S-methylmethionine-dependent homocysteine/selenocysteine methylase